MQQVEAGNHDALQQFDAPVTALKRRSENLTDLQTFSLVDDALVLAALTPLNLAATLLTFQERSFLEAE